ncbi:MAG: LysR family transcriptional regulator [Lachnospiraceae bacterium]|nr:LysR family transcriptional regulator [Lachnospiraceae bacterium]
MNANLEYYKVFYHVAGCGSLTQAAEIMCISQPAVSQAIKQLEMLIGGKLFLRTAKGVKLTPEGEVLYKYVKEGYETISLGEKKFRQLLDVDNGEIKIGASDMTLQFYLLPYLERFHDKYPNIKVNVANAPTPETLHQLQLGTIDFAVVSMPFEKKDNIDVLPVRKLETIFVAGNDFRRLKDKVNPLTEIENLPIICLEKNTSTRRSIDEFLGDHGVMMEPEFELATSDMIVQFAVRNLGVGCVVKDFAEKYLESGELFIARFDKNIPDRDMCIVTDNKNPMSVAGKKLLEMLKTI